jgi:hypothetical protein
MVARVKSTRFGCMLAASLFVLVLGRMRRRLRVREHIQQRVVDLDEPRSLRPTIGWQASEAMRHPAYQRPRTPPPHTRVKEGKKRARKEP